MGKLDGLCTITNVSFCNYASLPTDDDWGSVVGGIPSGIIPDTAKWHLTYLEHDRYSIQNVHSKYFLNTEVNPQDRANVRGSRVNDLKYTWKIVESQAAGEYYICAEPPSTLCWGLVDGSDRTPVELRSPSSDPCNRWKIRSLDAEAKQLPFADKLGVHLKEVLIRPGIESFDVKVDWEGLPLGTIDFMESISVMYQRRVVAVARPVQDSIATEHKTLFATLSVVDTIAFGEFVSSLVKDSAVQVTLRADRLRFHRLDRVDRVPSPDSGDIYRMETMLNMRGFDSFKDLVKIRQLRVTGSDAYGVFAEATAAIAITNPTAIDITASFTVSVHYREAKLGSAQIIDFRLQPGAPSERTVNWKFEPPPPMANEDVKTYISLYMTTTQDIPLQLRLENQSIMIGKRQYAIPSLVVQSHIQGLGSKFVQRAYARIGLGTVLSKKISFSFDFSNPLDTVMRIRAIEVDAVVLGTKLLSVKEIFDDFTIYPHNDRKSPEVKGVKLSTGRIAALRGAIPGTTVDVDIKSATIYLGNFVLEGVRLNLEKIPFSLDTKFF